MSEERIVPKKSSVVGRSPAPELLVVGELAINVGDRKLYSKDALDNVFEIGSQGFRTVLSGENALLSTANNGFLTITAGPNIQIDGDETTPSLTISSPGSDIGFTDRTQSTISFNDSTRTFTITPAVGQPYFEFWNQGKRFRKYTAESITIPNTSGIYWFYYDNNGVLNYKAALFTVFSQETAVSYVYWNATTSTSVITADERHGVEMDWATHEYLHRTRGTVMASGLAATGYTTAGDGSSDSHAQISFSNGTYFDEDLKISVSHSSTPTLPFEQFLSPYAKLPILYRSGPSGEWTKIAATDFPAHKGASRLQYNYNNGTQWLLQDIPDKKFLAMWIVATNNVYEPIIAIVGQRYDDNQTQAINNSLWENLSLDGLPLIELRRVCRVIYEVDNAFTNSLDAVIRYVTDLRELPGTSTVSGGGTGVNDHGELLGLSDDDHSQYVHISTARAITATHTFNPGVVGPAFSIGTNANNQLIAGLNADRLDGLDSTQFLRNDTSGTLTGNLTITGILSLSNTGVISALNLNNNDIIGVNKLSFNDPGPTEGIEWAGGNLWRIYESPNDLTTNASGNLQFVQNTTRRFTIATDGEVYVGTNKVYHQGNDGDTSGLDADLLDGQHGSYYTNATNISTGTVSTARLGTGTANSDTVLYGNNTWAPLPSSTGTNLSYSANSTSVIVASDSGVDAVIPSANSTTAGVLTASDKTKLDGIATGAQPGTVTSITSGSGLSGGTITTSGTISVAANSGIVANSTGVFVNANSGIVSNSSGVFVNAATDSGLTANSTGVHFRSGSGLFANTTAVYVNASAIATGTVPTARLGTGTANSQTFLSGDQTYKTAVTSITAGLGLSGGTITTSGTISLVANSGITANGTGVFVNASSISIGTLGTSYGGTGLTTFTDRGVLFASNTSTLATSANLVFTTTGLGIGTNSPLSRLDVRRPEASAAYVIPSNTTLNDSTAVAARFSYGTDDAAITAGTGIGIAISATPNRGEAFIVHTHPTTSKDSGDLSFWMTSGGVASEQMRLTAGGSVGIGTNNPGQKLQINLGSIQLSEGYDVRWGTYSAGSTGTVVAGGSSQQLALYTSGTERLQITANGNIGVSGTPSNWTGNFKAIEIQGSSIATNGPNNLIINTNVAAGVDGGGAGGTYGTTNPAAKYQQISGTHRWFTAASGTSGTAIDFSTAKMQLDNSGNLGIGTTPVSKLHVAGDIQQDNANYLKGKLADGTTTRLFGLNASNVLYIGSIDATHAETLFVRNGAEQMRIATSGNVGIGTSSPTSGKLQISSGSATPIYAVSSANSLIRTALLNTDTGTARRKDIQIGTGTSGLEAIYFGVDQAATGYKAYLDNRSGGSLAFQTSGSTQVVIDTSGNIGVATTSPAAKLDVVGGDGNGIQYRTGTRTVGIGQVSSEASVYWGSGTALTFFGGSERMRIDTAGNLGIGTNTPQAKLDLGSAVDASKLLVYGAGNVRYGFGIQTDTLRYFVPAGSAIHSFGVLSATDGTTYTERMRLDSSGTLGIGVVPSTSYKLDVGGAFRSSSFWVLSGTTGGAGGTNRYIGGAGTADSWYYNVPTGGNQYWAINEVQVMRLNQNGNLGIGTSSPVYRTHIAYDQASALGVYRDLDVTSVGAAASYIEIGARNGSTFVPGARIAGILNNPSTTGYIQFETRSGDALVERMRLDSSGNLGIGVSPSVNTWAGGGVIPSLDIGKSTTYSVIHAKAYGTVGNAGGMLVLSRSNSATVGTQTATASGNALGYISFEGVNSSSGIAGSSYLGAYQDGAAGTTYVPGRFVFFTSDGTNAPAERVRINSSGNVGIGTTPSFRLDVYQPTNDTTVRVSTGGAGAWFEARDTTSYYAGTRYVGNNGARYWLAGMSQGVQDYAIAMSADGANNRFLVINNAGNVLLGNNLEVAGDIEQGPNFAHPNVEWAVGGNSTGQVIFYLPGSAGTTTYGMVHMVFDFYEYATNKIGTVIVGGHNWSSTQWYNVSCNVIGNMDKTVQVGIKDGKYVVVFGTAASTWSYGTIRLRKVHNGSYYNNLMDLSDWSVEQTSATISYTYLSGDLRQLRTSGDFYAPIMYDINNTAYYSNPAGTSVFDTIQVNNINITGTVSGNAASADKLNVFDTRLAATTPQTYDGQVRFDFKENTTNGLTDGGSFNSVMYWRKYGAGSDWSGGGAAEIAYTDNQRLWMRYGTSTTWGAWKRFIFGDDFDNGGIVKTSGSFRAPVFYDTNDTSYYVDPASTSVLSSVQIWGGITGRNTAGSTSLDFASYDNYASMRVIRNTSTGSFNDGMYIGYANSNSGLTRIYGGGASTAPLVKYSGYTYEPGSFRAPIFYDSDDTNYYLDPTSISYINNIYIAGGVAGISNSSLYTEAAIEIRERGFGGAQDDTWATAPRLAFHWGGRAASQIGMDSAGRIHILNNPGNANQALQSGNFYAPIFYDSDNTGFYVDPGNISNVSTFRMANMSPNNGVWHSTPEGTNRFFFANSGTTYYKTGSNFIFRNSGDGGIVTIDGSGNLRVASGGDNFASYALHVGGTGYASGDFRAPIFYDTDDTGAYLNPAGNSVLHNITTRSGVWAGDLQGNTLLQAAYDYDGLFNVLQFKGAPTLYQWNGTTWLNSGTQSNLVDGRFAQNYGGTTLVNGRSEFVIDFGTVTGYTFPSALILKLSTQGSTCTVYFERATTSDTASPTAYTNSTPTGGASDGWTTLTSTSGVSTWPGTVVIKMSEQIGGSLQTRIRLRIVPTTWHPSNAITIGQVGLMTSYGSPTRLFEWDYNRTVTFNNAVYAPVFYDSNNTSYYVDPAGAASMSLAGDITLRGEINWVNSGGHFMDVNGDFYLRYSDNSSFFNDRLSVFGSGNYTQATGSLRAPIFYDSDNTGFYTDPAGISNIVALKINTAGTGASTRALTLRAQGQSEIDFGAYPGNWNSAIQIQNNANDRMLWMAALDSASANIRIRSAGSGLDIYTDGTVSDGGTYSAFIGSGSVRANIFYDKDDTNYYLDPNGSTSLFSNGVVVAGTEGFQSRFYSGGVRNRIWSFYNADSYGLSYFQGAAGIASNDTIGFHFGSATAGNSFLQINAAGYTFASGSIRSPLFYDSDNTGYYADPAGDVSFRGYGELAISNYAVGNLQPGALNIGRTDTNYSWTGGTWASDVRLGILANCTDNWEFAIHDSGERVVSAISFVGGPSNNFIEMGRDLGWGTTPILAANSFRAPIFYDSSNTSYYVDPLNGSVLGGQVSFAGGTYIATNGDVYARRSSGTTGVYYFADGGSKYLYWDGSNYLFGSQGGVSSSVWMAAPIFYNSGNTGYYWQPNVSAAHRLQTPTGFLDLGSMNSTYCHFQTDRSSFYFNKTVNVDGALRIYADQNNRFQQGALILRSTSPTIYFRDTDHNSAVLHCNSNQFYILRGDTDTEGWTQIGGQWPQYWDLTTNYTQMGGTAVAVGDMRAPIFYDYNNTGFYTDQAGDSYYNTLRTAKIRFASSTADLISGAPWYGAGMTDSDLFSTGGTQVQLASYYGLRLRTSSAIMDFYNTYIASRSRFVIGPYAGSVSSGNITGLEILNNGGTGNDNVAAISFHCSNQWGTHLHLRSDGYFGAGGWSGSSWQWYCNMATGDFTAVGSMRSPIFYDTGNTSYYVDPAGDSNLGSATFNKSATTTSFNIGNSGTAFTLNCKNSNVQTVTMTGNVAAAGWTISNPQDGQTINLFITQGSTAYTLGFPTSFKWPGGIVPNISTGANNVDLLVMTYRAATGFWYCSLLKNFS